MLTSYCGVMDSEAAVYDTECEETSVVLEEESVSDAAATETSVAEEETYSASLMSWTYTYKVLSSSKKTIEITGCTGSDKSLTIPSKIDGYTVTSIGMYAVAFGTTITSITIPNTVTNISCGAFAYEEALTTVKISASVTNIDYEAFYGCPKLKSFTVDSNNKSYSSKDGIIYNKAKTKIVLYPVGKSGSSFTVPSTVTAIGDGAFTGCDLTSIKMSDSVTSIGDYAFESCTNLKNITLSKKIKSIGSYTFSSCENLTSIKLPDSVTSIGVGAFSSCENLTSIVIPDGVTSISESAFANTGITDIIIPDGVKSIGEDAFRGCVSLKSITIPDSVKSIDECIFSGCDKLKNIYYTGTEKQWNKISFDDNWDDFAPSGMKIHYNSITEGETYTVGNFEYKANSTSGTVTLTKVVTEEASVEIPATVEINGNKYKVTAIGKKAFKGNKTITSLVIGKNVNKIGAKAFYKCKNLSSITIKSKKLTTSNVGSKAFSNIKSTVEIKVPAAKKSAYKKMLRKKGVSKKAKVSAI